MNGKRITPSIQVYFEIQRAIRIMFKKSDSVMCNALWRDNGVPQYSAVMAVKFNALSISTLTIILTGLESYDKFC